MKIMRSPTIRFVLLTYLLLVTPLATASFHKNLWVKWEVNNPLSSDVISHKEWQTFLTQFIITNDEGINLVDYTHLTVTDLDLIKHYITRMSEINISNYNRTEQLAYWLNLYNALTIQTVAHYYPLSSVQEINISPGLFSVGPWGATLVTLDKTPLSLDEIHNRIIRPIWNDPRTHYAINNATIGAPNLSKQAFQSAILEKQLNQAASSYINSFRGAQVIEGQLIVSSVYDWFTDDFGGEESDLIRHFALFAKEPLRSQLKHVNAVNSYTYNWHLNSTIEKTP